MELNKNTQQPLYQQLIVKIRDKIRSGEYKPGDKIPTEKDLSLIYNVSRITVRRTIEELCNQGYLSKCQGKGTFVEAPKIYRKIEQDNNMSFTETCIANGRKPSSHILLCELIAMLPRQNEFFQMDENDKIYHIQRILSADDLPLIFEDVYIPQYRIPNFDVSHLENASLFQMLNQEYHIPKSTKGRSTIEIATATLEKAANLRIAVGEPVMLLESYIYDHDDKPLYISKENIVGSRYRLSI